MERRESQPIQPILVVLVWRGGARFQRALESIRDAERYFKRVIFSITSDPNSEDMQTAARYMKDCAQSGSPSKAEIICSQVELPTMQHQEFWIRYVMSTGGTPDDWILWLAYDDALRLPGLESVTDRKDSWNLVDRTAYFGPWAMRHEGADQLWSGDADAALESWTSFPLTGPVNTTPTNWILAQVLRPTYMQMSGSIIQLSAHRACLSRSPRKRNPMRIELHTACMPEITQVAEFPEPISIIYGRPNSDRSNYGRSARREDFTLAMAFLRRAFLYPREVMRFKTMLKYVRTESRPNSNQAGGSENERWISRGLVRPR